jgi:hypothetical protein
MAEQLFKFPGFFDREIDLTAVSSGPVGVPAGIVGASEKGPAFVPYTVGSFNDFISKYGDLNSKYAAPYAVEKFLANRNALTFVRVLGAGSNQTSTDIENTRTTGLVVNAGFKITGSKNAIGLEQGYVQFLLARHDVTGSEAIGFPMFTDNQSYTMTNGSGNDSVYLVRGAIFTANDTRIQIMNLGEAWSANSDDYATPDATLRKIRIAVSTSQGATFGNGDGNLGVRIFTASLDPSQEDYFGKLLNTDPEKFGEQRHYLYADFAVDSEVANVGTGSNDICIASGSQNTSVNSGITSLKFRDMFGRFDTRYKNPKTTSFISQPFGNVEYDLFRIESLDDGAYANSKFKISIVSLNTSTNPQNRFGTFTVLVRNFADNDYQQEVLEQFNNVSLDPKSDNYIARVIGDTSVRFNFDAVDLGDRRVVVEGNYPNKSNYIRVVVNSEVERGNVPNSALPFGFRGPEFLKTNSLLSDSVGAAGDIRFAATASSTADARILAAIVPPLPFRFKLTRGSVDTSPSFTGESGLTEIADSRLCWGVKFERNTEIFNTNVELRQNSLVSSLTKFFGVRELDALVTGSNTDAFNSNKFTLARVALNASSYTNLTNTVDNYMKDAAYIRNGSPDVTNYTITDDVSGNPRITFATLLNRASGSIFNNFSNYAQFTTILYGGYDGINILDRNAVSFNDRSTSAESRGSIYGNCAGNFVSPGFSFNQNGTGIQNSTVNSYRTAIDIITNPMLVNTNILAIPGQRDPLVSDYALAANSNYGMSIYTIDIPNYNQNVERIWDGETVNTGTIISIEQTSAQFESRNIDNTLAAAYFPDIVITDNNSQRKVTVPASIAAMAALGYNDKVAYPWYAPAGFNRAALDFVSLTRTRLNQSDRERVYAARINPIVKFPRENYVIFAQKTLDNQRTSLDSINVQRMVLDVQRQVVDVGNRLIFEQITPALRQQFVKNVTPILTNVQSRQGLQQFKVICDETNNTNLDVENNKMNAKILLVPVKAVEFIAIDFVITRAGVQFV